MKFLNMVFMLLTLATLFEFNLLLGQLICNNDLPVSQYEALYSFYNSTNGPNWCLYTTYGLWDFSNYNVNAPCLDSWVGIQCNCVYFGNSPYESTYSVTSLSLASYCLNGSIPSSIGNLTNLYTIDLGVNQLNGTIPNSIGNILALSTLEIYSSYISGSLPETLYNLTNLFQINLSNNKLSGTISTNISNLKELFYLDLSFNRLHGSLPFEIGLLTSIFLFEISNNEFSGEIPSSIGNLYDLYEIIFYSNNFNGHIPTEIGKLTFLNTLNLNSNYLTGPIPTEFGNLVSIYYLDLSYNSLTGVIPSELSNCKNIQIFILNNNNLYSTIPTILIKFSKLLTLELSYNMIYGTIPSELSQLTRLQNIYLSFNFMTYSVPYQIYTLPVLQSLLLDNNYFSYSINVTKSNTILFLDLSNNYFTDSLPNTILFYSRVLIQLNTLNNYFTGALPSKIYNYNIFGKFVAGNNYFSSSIPTSYGQLTTLFVLYLFNNMLTSTIPSQLATINTFSYFWISSNQLTGTIPSKFGQLQSLAEILVDNNNFYGNVIEIFNYSVQPYLQVINLANNLFTGTIPSSIFLLKRLSALVITNNCMSGSIPDEICNCNDTLTVLSLDGLASNTNCNNNVNINKNKPSIISAYYQAKLLIGSIPPCLLQMKYLQTLHLSGNGLTGSIPEIINDSAITDLSLSNNQLIGSIPLSMQLHSFNSLDLASNKLNGVLNSNFVISINQSLLTLSVNRLSGELPISISNLNNNPENISTLNILSSNIYQCNSNNIPRKDSYSASYYCGSSEMNIPTFIWLGIGVAIILLFYLIKLLFIKFSMKSYFVNINFIITIEKRIKQTYAITISWWNESTRLLSPYSTNQNEKNYINIWLQLKQTKTLLIILKLYQLWSYVMLLLLLLVAVPIYIYFNYMYSIVSYNYIYVVSIAYIHGYEIVIFITVLILLILIISTTIITIYEPIFISNIGIAKSPIKNIKLVENYEKIKFVLKKYFFIYFLHLVNLTVTISVNAAYVNAILSYHSLNRLNLFFIQLSVGLFKLLWNNLYIPWATIYLSNYVSTPRSLKNRLIMSITNYIIAPVIATIATNQSCFYFALVKHDPISTTISVDVCTSFSQSNGACLQTTMVGFSTIFSPAFQYSYACGTALIVTYTPVLMYTFIFGGLLAPLFRYTAALFPYLLKPITLVNDLLFIERNNATLETNKLEIKKGIIRIRGRGITVTIMLHITVLLSFGLACPILGLAIIVTIINDALMWRLLVGRYVLLVKLMQKMYIDDENENESRKHSVDPATVGIYEFNTLEVDIEDSWRGLFSCYKIVVITVIFFWGLLIFDMIADIYDVINGAIVSGSFIIGGCTVVLCYYYLLQKHKFLYSTYLSNSLDRLVDIDSLYYHNIKRKTDNDNVVIVNPLNESFNGIDPNVRSVSIIEMNSSRSISTSIDRNVSNNSSVNDK